MELMKHKNKIFIIIFTILTLFIISYTLDDTNADEVKEKEVKEIKKDKEKTEKSEDKKVKVDIKGEIINPGVYELTEKDNVNDAINMAGGLSDKSDTSNLNLSKKLVNEMVIIVYSKDEIKKMKAQAEKTCPPCNNACLKESDEKAKLNTQSKESNSQDGKININTATKDELLKINGIGETKANSIIEYRNKNGNFNNIEEIKNVSGIGDAAFEKIKNQITI